MTTKNHIPVYSLDKFRKTSERSMQYQVELFDANRHFNVSYPHRHDFYEVLFISKGSGYHIIDGNKYEIRPPSVFFLSPGQTHSLALSNDVDGYIFLFTSEFYLLNQQNKNRLLSFPFFFSVDQNNPPLYLENQEEEEFLKTLFMRACMEVRQNKPVSEEIIRSILDLLLLSCDELYPEELAKIQKGKSHILVKRFLLLIEENYQHNLSISDYADKLSITPNHLTQMVKQLTGKTSLEILKEKYIVEIKRLLLHTTMSISEITELMHFSDQSYFSKYFKNCTGQTPLQYRKTMPKD